VPLGDGADSRVSSVALPGEEAPRARHRTCADVEPAEVDTLVIKRLGLGIGEQDLLRLIAERVAAPSSALSADLLRSADGSSTGTAFVRFTSPEAAQAALECLGPRPRLGGRRAHVEPQKSKALLGGRELETVLPKEDLDAVRHEVQTFVNDDAVKEINLPFTFSAQQRKYAHSMAEHHGLVHLSRQTPGGETYVRLQKASANREYRGRRCRRQSARNRSVCGSAEEARIDGCSTVPSGGATEPPRWDPAMAPVLLALTGLRPPPGLPLQRAPDLQTAEAVEGRRAGCLR